MKVNKKTRRAGAALIATAFGFAASAQASSTVTISDATVLSIELSAKQCTLTQKRTDKARWIDLRVIGRDANGETTGDRFEFRLGEEQGRPVEVLKIVAAGNPAYGPVSLFDVLEAELMDNMESWSAEKIAEQDDMIADADGQPLNELQDILISVDGTAADAYFDKIRNAERFSKSRVAPISVQASGVSVANSEDFVTATIALNGECRILFMTE